MTKYEHQELITGLKKDLTILYNDDYGVDTEEETGEVAQEAQEEELRLKETDIIELITPRSQVWRGIFSSDDEYMSATDH